LICLVILFETFAGNAREKIANEVRSAHVIEPGDGSMQDRTRSV